MQQERQHSVPEAPLKAGCDPDTPADQTARVWRFARGGSDGRRKAPVKLFRESDLYTISLPEGGRNLDYSECLRSKRRSRSASASVSRLRIFEDRPTTRRGAFERSLLFAHSAQIEGPVRGQSS